MYKKIKIRDTNKHDIPALLALIQELAIFEKAPNEVSNTEIRMLEDGFGEKKIFDAFVAEIDGKVVGCAVVYFRYSTWKGRCLYLEDLIISEPYRGLGAGTLLFERCIQFAKETNSKLMVWQVLDWNTPAIDFYKKYNAKLDGEWINGTLQID